MKDDEFEGDENAQKAMKGDVTAPFGWHASRHKIALQISLGLSTRSEFSWLEPLPVTQEAAGSSSVAPAILIGTRDISSHWEIQPLEKRLAAGIQAPPRPPF